MEYAQSMLDSETLRKAAARCGIHLSTAFRWRHRFLKLADQLNPVISMVKNSYI
jgi:transposase-like protein